MAKSCDIPYSSPADRKRSAPVLPPKTVPHNPTLLVKGSIQRRICDERLNTRSSISYSSRYTGPHKVNPAWFIHIQCLCHNGITPWEWSSHSWQVWKHTYSMLCRMLAEALTFQQRVMLDYVRFLEQRLRPCCCCVCSLELRADLHCKQGAAAKFALFYDC